MKTKRYFYALMLLLAISLLGGKAVLAAEGTCSISGTKCTDMAPDGKDWRSPDGMECWYEGVCSSGPPMRACCGPTTEQIIYVCNGKSAGATCNTGSFTGTCKAIPGSQNLYCNNPANPANAANSANSSQTNANSTSFGLSQPTGNNTPCNPNDNKQFCNPLRYNSVEQFLAGFLTALQRIIAVIALIYIVIGALMYITSAGDSGQTTKAKNTIYAAMIGLAIAVAAPSFLKEISILLGWSPEEASIKGALTLTQIALNVLNFLLAILGVIALIMLVISGITYVTANGDSKKAESAKNIAKYAIIGVIVAMASMVMLQQVARFFVNTSSPTASSAANIDPAGL